jgi:hypothetical protein
MCMNVEDFCVSISVTNVWFKLSAQLQTHTRAKKKKLKCKKTKSETSEKRASLVRAAS